MARKMNFWMVWLTLFLGVALLAPLPVQAKEGADAAQIQRAKLAKDLQLTPEKAKEFQAVGDKYARSRQALIEQIKKNEGELEKALAAPKADAAKIKNLVTAISAHHSQLFETFKVQRQEELRLLTPVQQGKFIMALKKWHKEMCQRYEKPEKK
jgi:Spy/CpxP family protein refolding chaperone